MIDNYIKQNNLTREKFCRNCKISYESFLKVMRNETHFRINVVFKIAKGMELEKVSELFYDKIANKKE